MKSNLLEKVLLTHSPSGYENGLTDLFASHMLKLGAKHEFSDKVGNVAFSLGNGEKTVMISAHCDEIGMQVQYIDDDGFIHFIKDGGIDKKVLPSSHVIILHDSKQVHGVIGKTPIHVEFRSDDKDKAIDIKDMKIDIGAENKGVAAEMVSIGDPIVMLSMPSDIGENRFCGKGLDDKLGIFAVMEVMEEVSKWGDNVLNNIKIVAVACTQEETSASGATIAATRINPSYSIDFDVTFATDDGYVKKEEWGDVKLGHGSCIVHGVDNNKQLVKLIRTAATNSFTPFQEFSIGSGGTDTVSIKQSCTDCETALISIPIRNMHTSVEVGDYNDLNSAIKMTCETLKYLSVRP